MRKYFEDPWKRTGFYNDKREILPEPLDTYLNTSSPAEDLNQISPLDVAFRGLFIPREAEFPGDYYTYYTPGDLHADIQWAQHAEPFDDGYLEYSTGWPTAYPTIGMPAEVGGPIIFGEGQAATGYPLGAAAISGYDSSGYESGGTGGPYPSYSSEGGGIEGGGTVGS